MKTSATFLGATLGFGFACLDAAKHGALVASLVLGVSAIGSFYTFFSALEDEESAS